MRALIAGCCAGMLAAALLTGCSEAPERPKSSALVKTKPSGSTAEAGPLKTYTYAAFEKLLASHQGKVVFVDMWAFF